MTRFAAEQIVREKEPHARIVTEEEIKAASTPVNMKGVIKAKPIGPVPEKSFKPRTIFSVVVERPGGRWETLIVDTANKCIVGVSG